MTSRETTCGLGPWRPAFLQPLASKKVYMFFYGCLGIIQGMFFTYLSATLSTIERKFGIKSKESAVLMSGNEISQILFLFAMPVMIKLKKRPLWTAVGLWCTAIGCFLMALPQLISGDMGVINTTPGHWKKAAMAREIA
jgi:cyanate permease